MEPSRFQQSPLYRVFGFCIREMMEKRRKHKNIELLGVEEKHY